MSEVPVAIIIAPLIFLGACYLIYLGLQGRDKTFYIKFHPFDESNKFLNRFFAIFWVIVLLVVMYLLAGGSLRDIGTAHFFSIILKLLVFFIVFAIIKHYFLSQNNKDK